MTVVEDCDIEEMVWRYVMGESPADLSEAYGYKRTTIKQLMKRRGLLRTKSDSAKLAVGQGKKDKAISAFFAARDLPENRWHPNKSHKGSEHPRYIKDRTKVKSRHRHEHSLWRKEVFARDDYTCQECGSRGGRLSAHHIKAWANYPELRFNLSNGMTLCEKCHLQTDNYGAKARAGIVAIS